MPPPPPSIRQRMAQPVKIEKKDTQPTKEDIPLPSTQNCNLTQFFKTDLFAEDISFCRATSTLSSLPQSSQIFLEDVRDVTVPDTTQNSTNITDGSQKIYKSVITVAAYIEKQRDMHDANQMPLNTSALLVQQRLNQQNSVASSASTPPVTASSENPAPGISVPDVGPFFGLPAIVENLIQDFKGIMKLYGRSSRLILQSFS